MLATLVLVLSVVTVLVALARSSGRERPHGPVLTTLARDAADGAVVLARLVDRGRG